MNVDQLRYLMEINKCTSISQAANNLHISHQALSASIRSLEKELGVPLMDKTPRGTKLTLRGKQLVEISSDFIHALDDIFYVQKKHEVLQLKILAGYVSITDLLAEKIYELSDEKLKINPIFIENNNNFEVIDKVSSGDANIGFFAVFHEPKLTKPYEISYLIKEYPMLEYRSVTQLPILCELSSSHPLAYLEKMPLSKIQNHPLVYFYPRFSSQEIDAQNKKQFRDSADLFTRFFSRFEFSIESNPTIYSQKISSGEYIGITASKNIESLYVHKRIPLLEDCYFEIFSVRRKNEQYSVIENQLYYIH